MATEFLKREMEQARNLPHVPAVEPGVASGAGPPREGIDHAQYADILPGGTLAAFSGRKTVVIAFYHFRRMRSHVAHGESRSMGRASVHLWYVILLVEDTGNRVYA